MLWWVPRSFWRKLRCLIKMYTPGKWVFSLMVWIILEIKLDNYTLGLLRFFFSIYSVFFFSFIHANISNRVFCFFTCRFLAKGQNALIELQTQRPVALELYKDFKELGRFMLRYSGSTIAAGVVTEVWHFCNRLSIL